GARRGRLGYLAGAAAGPHRAARGRRDHPADRRPAQAPRVRRLPRRSRILARDPRHPGRTRRQRPPPSSAGTSGLTAVIFDLDGVLVDSEQAWDQARRDVVDAHGGAWKDSATRDMLGMSSKEWPVYVVEQLGARLTPDEVNAAVVEAMLTGYRQHLPLLPG